jgi:histidinol-phosphate aminotransferase
MVKYRKHLDDVHRIEVDKDKSNYKWRLDQSERLIDFPKEFWDEFMGSITQNDFITYPYVHQLKEKLAQHHNFNSTDNIFLVPGSDLAIRTMFDVFVTANSNVITTTPCFPMYEVYSKLYNTSFRQVPYDEDLTWSIDKLIDMLNDETSLVIIANPNNPIGDWVSNMKLRELFSKTQKMGIPVLVDEAYQEFVEKDNESCLTMGFKFSNVICCRTFSKAKGAAGIRVGYVVTNKPLIDVISKFRIMHEITGPSAKFACHILDNYKIVKDYIRDTNVEKWHLTEKFKKAGYDVIGGHCNWVHINSEDDNKKLCEILDRCTDVTYKAGVKIPFDDRTNWLRMTVGPNLMETNFIKRALEL